MVQKRHVGFKHPIKDNSTLQYILGISPLCLMILYMLLITCDFTSVYNAAYMNAETVKTDESIISVASWNMDSQGKYILMDTDGNEIETEDTEISIVMDSGNGLAYYSESANMLMQPVDYEYITNMLIGYNAPIIFACMGVFTLSLVCIVYKGDFIVLSDKVFLKWTLAILLLSASVIGIFYWMFS